MVRKTNDVQRQAGQEGRPQEPSQASSQRAERWGSLSPRGSARATSGAIARRDVEAARRILVQKGIAGTTLDAVAEEVGLTKAAIYYYYPSKDALFFEIIYRVYEAETSAIHDAVAKAKNGGEALRAIIRETVHAFAPNMDDFRVAFLHSQVVKPGTVRITQEQLTRSAR